MKHRTLAAVLALAVLSVAPAASAFNGIAMISPPDPQETRQVPERDENFLKLAAQSDMAEIEMARLALERATSDAIKGYAQHMIDDHKSASVKNMMIAQHRRVNLPMGLSPEQQATRDRLASLSGTAFDHAYIKANIEAHAKAVQLFRDQAAYGLDPDVRHFAATLLPTLHQHWEAARKLGRADGHGHRHGR